MERLSIVWDREHKECVVFLGNDITTTLFNGRGVTVIDALKSYDSIDKSICH